MDRAEREDAAGAGVDRAAVGRATVPADTGHAPADSAESNDGGRADRPAGSPARPAGGPSGRVGVASVLTSAPPAPSGVTSAPPATTAPANAQGSSPAPSGSTQTKPAGTPTRPQRPAGLATVGTATVAGGSAGRVAEAVRSARSTVSSAAGRGPRRARLFVKRVDPWSVMKFSFAVSFVMFFVLIVATAVLYLALDQMDVFSHVNSALATITSNSKNVKVTAGVVIGGAGGLGLVGVVLFTALSTLGAFVYNVCADLVGGIEVTLSERE
jgi:hypothetical protein